MTTENQSILTQRHGVESLPAAWRNTFEMHGLEWDAGYNAARIACADELAATLTQQQGGEQEARNLVENFEELVSDCHNGDETGWASPRERDRIRANRIAAREELIAALRTPTAEVGIGDEARLRDYPKLLAFFSKHALGTLAAPSCLCCGHSTQGVEIGVQHLELPAIVICAPCHTAALRTKQPAASEGDGHKCRNCEGIEPTSCIYNTSKQAAGEAVDDEMIQRGLDAAIEATYARLARYSVVRAILTAALHPGAQP